MLASPMGKLFLVDVSVIFSRNVSNLKSHHVLKIHLPFTRQFCITYHTIIASHPVFLKHPPNCANLPFSSFILFNSCHRDIDQHFINKNTKNVYYNSLQLIADPLQI